MPVWGLGTVIQSNHDVVKAGSRIYGYFPAASHTDLVPDVVTPMRFTVRRPQLPADRAVYNVYEFCATDPLYNRETENELIVMRPLWMTSFLLSDYIDLNSSFGATTILVTSASSKTAFCFAQLVSVLPASRRPRVVGLTSARNVPFVQSLKFYDEVIDYAAVSDHLSATAVGAGGAIIVDVAGDAKLTRRIIDAVGGADHVRKVVGVGFAHVDLGASAVEAAGSSGKVKAGSGIGLAVDKEVFFAPKWFIKRTGELGSQQFSKKIRAGWMLMMGSINKWVNVHEVTTPAEFRQLYLDMLEGKSSPDVAYVVTGMNAMADGPKGGNLFDGNLSMKLSTLVPHLPPHLAENAPPIGSTGKQSHCERSLAPAKNLAAHPHRDSHDTRASAHISRSNGPAKDARFFYSTVYSTTHNEIPRRSVLLANPINGVHAADLKNTRCKQRTGYTKNLAAFVEYDKNVDESADFFIQDPFLTAHCADYRRPPAPKSFLANPNAGITPMVPSGFTRLPIFNVTQDGSSKFNKDKETAMKASYPDGQLQFKTTYVNKKTILPSATAYISDEGEIKSLGDLVAVSETGRVCDPQHPALGVPEKPWLFGATIPDTVRPDGYSRSTRPKDPLLADYPTSTSFPAPHRRLSPAADMDRIRHVDLAEWVHRSDPGAKSSFSRIVHPPMDLMANIKSLADGKTRIGLKEPTGGVLNNPKLEHIPDPLPVAPQRSG
ncbi:hypothetical protein HDU83_001013 [Entophlyctis luteolus]|nr:hypothetical protein HDU83_001013 [Entophlyctis luteolus]